MKHYRIYLIIAHFSQKYVFIPSIFYIMYMTRVLWMYDTSDKSVWVKHSNILEMQYSDD